MKITFSFISVFTLLAQLVFSQAYYSNLDYSRALPDINPAFSGQRGTVNFLLSIDFLGSSLTNRFGLDNYLVLDSRLPIFSSNKLLSPSFSFTHRYLDTSDDLFSETNFNLANEFDLEKLGILSIGIQYSQVRSKQNHTLFEAGNYIPNGGFYISQNQFNPINPGYSFGIRHSFWNNRLVYGLSYEEKMFYKGKPGKSSFNFNVSGILTLKENFHIVPSFLYRSMSDSRHVSVKFYYKQWFYIGYSRNTRISGEIGFIQKRYKTGFSGSTNLLTGGRFNLKKLGVFELGACLTSSYFTRGGFYLNYFFLSKEEKDKLIFY